ncbi:MAG: hypothetical protein V4654_08630 [Bdellovibrionota bacterium]
MTLKNLLCTTLCFWILFTASVVKAADALIALGAGFAQDRNTLSDQSPVSDYAYNVAAYAPLTRGDRILYLGIEYLATAINQSLDATTKATLISTDFMLALKYGFAENELFAITAGFSPYTQAQYKVTALSKDTWYGTSYIAKLSIQPDLGLKGTKLKVAASILYYHSAYTKKSNNSAATSSSGSLESFERSFTLPTIELIFKF